MSGYEVWEDVKEPSPREKDPPTREEWLRLERVAVGKICGCKSCLCCEELRKEKQR